ncbi:MAG: dimethyl sulfoxide reductase anchor subunit [Alphaproteobacteria bacterium]|nr:dimethyl sulfoxide reductase anchor subunit [Alphaproteobacteria bacterium]
MPFPYAIVFLTVASGAGYGFVTLLAFFQAGGQIPPESASGYVAFPVAGVLIAAGLFSSAFHPDQTGDRNPTGVKRLSSWGGREQIFAALACFPTAVYAAGWIVPDWRTDTFTIIGMLAAICCMQTVYCTAMVYASTKAVRAWSGAWVALGFFGLSIMTGALMLNALAAAFGHYHPALFWVAAIAIVISGVVKMQYWRSLDASSEAAEDDDEDADDFVFDGKYYRLACAYAEKLRQLVIASAFVAPILLLTLSRVSEGSSIAPLAILALILGLMGVLIERLLFFAEARGPAEQ